jgi:tRNA-specific 2-thiouridylase
LDAKKICRQLKIPFVFLNLEKEYKKNIFDYMIDSYKKGETPNPDVFCNKFIKFGAFLEVALKNNADFVAMGHYARVNFNKSKNTFELLKGLDLNKDQSYFLSSISQYQLSKALFPIGELQKIEVRKIAEENNLLTAKKKDSQGLCFVGKVNMREFLQNFVEKKEGRVLNLRGEEIGKHEGAIFYTIGERHGFEIFPKFRTPNTPRSFVLKKDIEKNTITIGEKNIESENILNKKEIQINKVN